MDRKDRLTTVYDFIKFNCSIAYFFSSKVSIVYMKFKQIIKLHKCKRRKCSCICGFPSISLIPIFDQKFLFSHVENVKDKRNTLYIYEEGKKQLNPTTKVSISEEISSGLREILKCTIYIQQKT